MAESHIDYVVEPRAVKTWEEFRKTAPAFSIALDGYVYGPTQFDESGPRLNLNHHEGVDRLSTRSTSGQMLIYIKQGLFEKFSKDGFPTATMFVNDGDQDAALSLWLGKNHERAEGVRSEPLINRLVFAEDVLDATAGAYPFPLNSDIMRDIAWIFGPYTDHLPVLPRMDSASIRAMIEEVHGRITQYTLGRGKQTVPDARFKMMHQADGWAMIEERGMYARTKLFNQGTRAFVAFRGEDPKYKYRYSIGRMSPFINFPLLELYEELNAREGLSDSSDRWGGGNTIGGSPRNAGSSIAPGQLACIIDDFLEKRRAAA